MRICRRCKEEKDDKEFGRLKSSKDGVNPRCRRCCCESVKNSTPSPESIEKKKKYVAEWQKRNREKRLEQSRDWYARNLDKARAMSLEATKKYFKTERGKKLRRERGEKWKKENPEKALTQSRFKDAVRYGKIIRPNQCENCKEICVPHGHHEDYDKPYDVVWLCEICHFYLHHKPDIYAERTSGRAPKGEAMFRPLEETERVTQK